MRSYHTTGLQVGNQFNSKLNITNRQKAFTGSQGDHGMVPARMVRRVSSAPTISQRFQLGTGLTWLCMRLAAVFGLNASLTS